MITEAEKCLYFSYHPAERIPCVFSWVIHDEELQRKLFHEECVFWDYVCNLSFPEEGAKKKPGPKKKHVFFSDIQKSV
jgi:hypothetical protein